MESEPLFIDTGGFYALMVSNSPGHNKAREIMTNAERVRRPLVTTDYIVQETATLLVARRQRRIVEPFFERTITSQSLTTYWITPERFADARRLMRKFDDQPFSFTDCVSFVLMRELALTDALATDSHFRTAGFIPLLADNSL